MNFLNLVTQIVSLHGSYTKKQLVYREVILNLRQIRRAADCFLPYKVAMKFIFLKMTFISRYLFLLPFFSSFHFYM